MTNKKLDDVLGKLIDQTKVEAETQQTQVNAMMQQKQEQHQKIIAFTAATKRLATMANGLFVKVSEKLRAGQVYPEVNADFFGNATLNDSDCKEDLQPLQWMSFMVPARDVRAIVLVAATHLNELRNPFESSPPRKEAGQGYVYYGSIVGKTMKIDRLQAFDPAAIDEDSLSSLIADAIAKVLKKQ
jgi:hypothetical protein